jgi:Natural resistance-associated macrophage protein
VPRIAEDRQGARRALRAGRTQRTAIFYNQVTENEDAYRLLAPIVSTAFAAVLFAVAFLASGQSSTFRMTNGRALMGEIANRLPTGYSRGGCSS